MMAAMTILPGDMEQIASLVNAAVEEAQKLESGHVGIQSAAISAGRVTKPSHVCVENFSSATCILMMHHEYAMLCLETWRLRCKALLTLVI